MYSNNPRTEDDLTESIRDDDDAAAAAAADDDDDVNNEWIQNVHNCL